MLQEPLLASCKGTELLVTGWDIGNMCLRNEPFSVPVYLLYHSCVDIVSLALSASPIGGATARQIIIMV